MRWFYQCVVAICISSSAYAQSCTNIRNTENRLDCYDQENGFIDWVSSEGPYNSNDVTDLVIAVRTISVVNCGLSRSYSQRAYLSIECIETGGKSFTSIALQASCKWSLDSDNQSTKYRANPLNTEFIEFANSANFPQGAVGSIAPVSPLDNDKSVQIIKSLFSSESVDFAVQLSDQSEYFFNFDISGLEEAITPLREACHW